MSCKHCHEGTPPYRDDGFCSDICLIHYLQGEIERLRDERAHDVADLLIEIERLRALAKHERSLGAEKPMIELMSVKQEIRRLHTERHDLLVALNDALRNRQGWEERADAAIAKAEGKCS